MKLYEKGPLFGSIFSYLAPLAGNHEVYQSSAGMLVTLKLTAQLVPVK